MATKKITDLVEIISAASGDVLPIVDISDDITKKIQVSNFPISTAAQTAIDAKQDTLVSGTNIKTLNSESLLGSGNIEITASPAGVAGAIQFSDGSAFASDASNLFWDDTNNRLGIGTNAPASQQEIKGNGDQLWITNSSDIYTYLKLSGIGGFFGMTFGDGNGTVNYLNNYGTGMWASNKFAFGPSLFTPSGQVHIKGSGTTSATTSLLVQNSAGTAALSVKDDGNVGIGTNTLSAKLQVKGDGTNPIARFEELGGLAIFQVTTNGLKFGGSYPFGSLAYSIVGTTYGANNNGSGFAFYSQKNGAEADAIDFGFGGDAISNLTGIRYHLSLNRNFSAGAGAGNFRPLNIAYTLNNSGVQTGNATGIFLNATETALNGMTHNLMDLQVNGSSKFEVLSTGSTAVSINSTTQGFLPPRMTTTQKNAISSPASGLQVYDTTLNQMSYYNGTSWVNF